MKGASLGAGLLKASAPGMAMAGIAHLTANAARKSFLTIATDKKIHTLTNQSTNGVGLKTSNKGHDDVARALQAAGEAVLGVIAVTSDPGAGAPAAVASPGTPEPASAPTLLSRLRELADLHKGGHPLRRGVRRLQGEAARRALISAIYRLRQHRRA